VETLAGDGGKRALWGAWATLGFGAVIASVFFMLQTAVILLGVAVRGQATSEWSPEIIEAAGSNGLLISLSTLLTTVVGCALVVAAIKLKRGSDLREYLALVAVPWRTLAKWVGVLAVMLIAWDVFSLATGRPIVPEFMRLAYATADPVWMLWLALIVAAPLFEEVFFRGFLLTGLAASALRPMGAVVLTAALWAVVHAQYEAVELAFIFLLGVVFGAARLASGSLLVPLTLHALTNLGATVEAALL
jgi:hypothetical protein